MNDCVGMDGFVSLSSVDIIANQPAECIMDSMTNPRTLSESPRRLPNLTGCWYWPCIAVVFGSLCLGLSDRVAAAEQPHLLSSGDTGSSGAALWHAPGTSSDVAEPGKPVPSKMGITVGSVTGCVVRVAYVVPSNRTPQSNAVARLQLALRRYQDWYRDQMDRNGFGPKSFRYETEADGTTPKVYVADVSATDEYLRGDIWGRTISAASGAGVPIWTSRQVWWLISEAHAESSNGSISGGTALGASYGSGDDAGVAMLGGDSLARFHAAYLTNDSGYAGRTMPELGPYPLVQDVSFPWFEGSSLSSISSSVLGAGLHEMSHAFGLPHDFRNDENFKGNLMGNGLRGIRGNIHADKYPTDYTRLTYASALALSVSRYFNPVKNYTDNTAPNVTVSTSGTNTPSGGLLQINFTASDASGLAAAWLILNGDLVGEMPLKGTSTNTSFQTAYYNPGENDNFTISVFDTQGNKRSVEKTIVTRTGYNRAPRPYLKIPTSTAYIGQSVRLDVSSSSDPDGAASSLKVEWDFDGDGSFDSVASTTKGLNYQFSNAGDFLVRARLTDSGGAQTISTAVPVRVTAPTLGLSRTGDLVRLMWPSAASGFGLKSVEDITSTNWITESSTPVLSGGNWVVTVTNLDSARFFRLQR